MARSHQVAQELPGSTLERPFGPSWEVYKVRGKMFLAINEAASPEMVNVKCDPEEARALRAAHDWIAPGYHMNKRHWIAMTPGEETDPILLRELIIGSYLLVVAALPRARRPVDPLLYAHAAGLAQ